MRRVLRKIAKNDPDIGNPIFLKQTLIYEVISNGLYAAWPPFLTSTRILNEFNSVTYRRYFHNGRWIRCSSLARWI